MKFKNLFEKWEANPSRPGPGMRESPHHDELIGKGFRYSSAQSSQYSAGYIADKGKVKVSDLHSWAQSKGMKPERQRVEGYHSYSDPKGSAPYRDSSLGFSVHPDDEEHVQVVQHRISAPD